MNLQGYDPQAPSDGIRVIFVFGANGSGKSTAIAKIREEPTFPKRYINADDIARNEFASVGDPFQRNLLAAQRAEELRLAAIKSREDFALETVMSTPGRLALITQARTAGFEVDLFAITTDSSEINVRRVAQRVARGGHEVPEEKIVSRYQETMRLLPHAVDHAQRAHIIDNSRDGGPSVLVAEKLSHLLTQRADDPPAWYKPKLEAPYQQLQESKREIHEAFVNSRKSPESRLLIADSSHGRAYGGTVLAVTDKHVLQRVSDHLYLAHDRVFSPGREFSPGQYTEIQYLYAGGKVVQAAPPREADR